MKEKDKIGLGSVIFNEVEKIKSDKRYPGVDPSGIFLLIAEIALDKIAEIEKREQIETKVTTIISSQLGEGRVEEDGPNLNDMGADSLDRMSILVETEEAFNIEIKDDLALEWRDIDDIVCYVVGVSKT